MMICRARASKITHLYNQKPGIYEADGTSRGYSTGNVAILPQDTVVLRDILPPNKADIEESICAIFINQATRVTRENISQQHPVLVSKNRVKTLLEFLTTHNAAYSDGLAISAQNLENLYLGDDQAGIPVSVEIRTVAKSRTSVDVADPEQAVQTEGSELLMEAVGYTQGDFSHGSYKYMKGVALDACLKGQKFVQVRNGANFTDDENPLFLTQAFPHLDPWGIAGFYNPNRDEKQHISFERQLKNMLRQHNRQFIDDPNFAYTIAFKTSERHRRQVTEQLLTVQPGLQSMIKKWKANPEARPVTEVEEKAVKLLSMVKMIPKTLHGRNEIRSLIKKFGTPALFEYLKMNGL
ncbi:hypothetical protein K438DRAFT_2089005 [Mycena galopus ATCC 62051]|nr:hypothetical protein K438DRAFT_2089005 [Mycena galopus ATCC 62051]